MNRFEELTNEELMDVDGGIGLLAAAGICAGCFIIGGVVVYGVSCLIGG